MISLSKVAFAQEQTDSQQLPFALANEKNVSEEDLKNKKEGIYVAVVLKNQKGLTAKHKRKNT